MPDYRWSCQSCGQGNSAKSDTCAACGCPASANGETLENWQVEDGQKPQLPSRYPFWSRSFFATHETENCPACQMHMYLSDRQCPHCGFEQDSEQRHAFFDSHERKKTKAMWQGSVFMVCVLAFLTLLFYWMGLPTH